MITRDAGCILVGLGGIAHQTLIVPVGAANALLLGTFVAVLGIPATVGALALRNGAAGTNGSSSSSPEPPQSPAAPSSPSPPQ
jgi:UDP-N-acetylenolpyruvoylglucosamine reductase